MVDKIMVDNDGDNTIMLTDRQTDRQTDAADARGENRKSQALVNFGGGYE